MIDFRISVPSAVNALLQTVSGKIEVGQVRGKLELAAVNGSIQAHGVVGDFKASTLNGGIEVHIAEPKGGHVECKTINGVVEMTLPKDAAIDFNASVLVGSIETDFDTEDEGAIQKVRRARLNGAGREVEITALNSRIVVHRK